MALCPLCNDYPEGTACTMTGCPGRKIGGTNAVSTSAATAPAYTLPLAGADTFAKPVNNCGGEPAKADPASPSDADAPCFMRRTKHGVVIVDAEDAHWITDRTPTVHPQGPKTYVSIRIGKEQPRLGRAIMSAAPGEVVDHINGNPLDNRKANLRICTPAENARNRRVHRAQASGFKGVYGGNNSVKNPWRAGICVNGKYRTLGFFGTAIEAARAYDEAARTEHGQFACVNFPREGEQSAFRPQPLSPAVVHEKGDRA